jgi:DNA (cytosine-5)-methyltransferase 1
MGVLTYGSLFAGVGGFDMGFDRAGYDCRFQVEWDKHCQSILRKHWPEVPKWGDVSEVSGTELPPVDVLIFGSPCQDLSVAGKRAGLDGARSGLFHEAMRIIKEMRDATEDSFPRVVVWENVVGALSSNGGADFGTVLDQMAEAGAMVVEWAVLDAQHFGVPQRRRRVFVVAVFDPATAEGCPDPLLPVREGVRGDSAKGRKKGQATADPVAGGVGGGSGVGERGDGSDNLVTEVAACLRSGGKGGVPSGRGDGTDNLIAEPVAGGVGGGGEGFRMLAFGAYADDDTASAMKARDYKDATDLVVEQPLSFGTQFGSNANVFEDTSPTLKSSQQSPSVAYDEYNDRLGGEIHHALRAGTKQSTGVLTPMAVRRLTPLECERLMGWPDDHTRWKADGTEQADTHRYKQCGNGVATPVAQWIAAHLKGIL